LLRFFPAMDKKENSEKTITKNIIADLNPNMSPMTLNVNNLEMPI
jgi:hypothetical protein